MAALEVSSNVNLQIVTTEGFTLFRTKNTTSINHLQTSSFLSSFDRLVSQQLNAKLGK